MSKQPPFILVDGSSYLFRAYHALPPLTNSQGQPTGAIVGVVNMLRKLQGDYQPRLMAVVFDAPGKTFRHELYSQYKAHRPPTPPDLKAQIEPLHQIVRALGFPLLSVAGVEADDVIGTLARQATEQGMDCLISTGDKDMAQLVNQHVTLINTMSDTLLDEAGVVAKFGVRPDQIVDYLALMGDSADNIPGIYKCGEKTAAKWLQQFDTLDNLVAKADEISGKIGENLRAGLAQLPLSRQLTTIDTQVPLECAPQDLRPQPADKEKLRTLYEQIESSRLLATLDRADIPIPDQLLAQINASYETLLGWDRLTHWLKRLQDAELFALDTETTSLDAMSARLVGMSFALAPGDAAYLPLTHDYPGAPEQLALAEVLEKLKPLLESTQHLKVGQNLKYDLHVLGNHGIALKGIAFDSMLESYVLDPSGSRHNLDTLAEKYLGYQTVHFEDIAGKGAKQIGFNQVALEQAAPYAAEDADICLRLHQQLWPKIQAEGNLKSVFEQLDLPLLEVLARMERNGVLIDRTLLKKQGHDLGQRIQAAEQKAYQLAGHSFNLGSPKQIGQILFEELNLPVISRTAKGAPSTDESVLQELASQGAELPAVILEHRGLAKLKSTYVDKLPEMINPATGRLHTSYNQAVTATGRLSSSDPNLQNIPVKDEDGRRIRQAFIAPPGYVLLAADYSQIELRIMAHLSQDAGLLKAFAEGRDIHAATAAEIFGCDSVEQVSREQRRSAKAINFGLIYGMSAFGLANQLGISRNQAQDYVNLYFSRYPGVLTYMDRTRAQAHQQGYVETLFGRRLYLPEINARNKQRQAGAERAAINAPMQGTAADIIKKAMISLDGWIESEQPDIRMLLQVHDELVFELPEDQALTLQPIIVDFMQSAAKLEVPLIVEAGVGRNWEEAH